MTCRRGLAGVALAACLSFSAVRADEAGPREALGTLKAGNDRFARNASVPVSIAPARRQELSREQQPLAMVLSCADARVPPELIFNVGLGDLYVVRTAGHVADKAVLGTLEYGAGTLHIPLLVVLGHESCDIVRAAGDGEGEGEAGGPNQEYLRKAIQESAEGRSAEDRNQLRAAVLANVEHVINGTLAGSDTLRNLVDAGELQVVGGYYELVSGRVMFSEPVVAASPAARSAAAAKGQH